MAKNKQVWLILIAGVLLVLILCFVHFRPLDGDDWQRSSNVFHPNISAFSLEGTDEAQAIIESWQNPTNCANQRFLVFKVGGFNNGMGSDLHVESFAMARAISLQRILIYEPDSVHTWPFAENRKYCFGSLNPDCFLRNLTSCPRPTENQIVRYQNWTELATSSAQFVSPASPWDPILLPSPLDEVYKSVHALIHTRLANESEQVRRVRWIRSQFARYRVRPNARMKKHVSKIHRSLIPDSASPLFCVNVRHADKGSEMKLHAFDEYMALAEKLRSTDTFFSSFERINVLLSTEDNQVIHEAHAYHQRRPLWSFHYTDIGRGNENNVDAITKYGAINVALNALTNLFLSDNCNAFFTTRGSNWGRLIDELRRTQGKENYPFFDLTAGDGSRFASNYQDT